MTNHRHGDQSGGVMDIREVLRPFAALADVIDGYGHEPGSTCEHRLNADDIRAARAALASLPAEAQGDGAVVAWRVVLDGTTYQWHNAPPPIFPPDKGRIEYAYTRAAPPAHQDCQLHGCQLKTFREFVPPAVKVPSGWKLVPIEATPDMCIDGGVAWNDAIAGGAYTAVDAANAGWTAMLYAAPTVSAQKGEG